MEIGIRKAGSRSPALRSELVSNGFLQGLPREIAGLLEQAVIGREEALAFARERRAMGSGTEKQVEAEVRFG